MASLATKDKEPESPTERQAPPWSANGEGYHAAPVPHRHLTCIFQERMRIPHLLYGLHPPPSAHGAVKPSQALVQWALRLRLSLPVHARRLNMDRLQGCASHSRGPQSSPDYNPPPESPAVVRMPAGHSRRFKGERPIGAATG